MELLTPVPSGHLHIPNSSPLPGSALLVPHFITQPPPALVEPPGGPGRGGAQDCWCLCSQRRPWLEGGGEPAQMGSHPSAHGSRGQCVGKGVAMVVPPLMRHSTIAPCFCGGPGFLHNLSQLWSSHSLPFRLSPHSQ